MEQIMDVTISMRLQASGTEVAPPSMREIQDFLIDNLMGKTAIDRSFYGHWSVERVAVDV